MWCGFVSYHCQWQYTLCTVFKSIHIPLEPHSTFFTTNNGSKIVLCAIGCTPQWICFVLLKLFGTRIRHIVLLTDFSRTVFVWCGFVSYHCQWQYTFLYETDPFVCFFVFVVYNLKHTVHFSQPKMSQNLYFVPLVANHEWICFVLLKLFLYQAGTKKVLIVRNPFESFESSEKLGG